MVFQLRHGLYEIQRPRGRWGGNDDLYSTGWGAAGDRGQLPCAKPSTLSLAASLFLSYILVEGGGLNRVAKGAAKISSWRECPCGGCELPHIHIRMRLNETQSSDCNLGFSPRSFFFF